LKLHFNNGLNSFIEKENERHRACGLPFMGREQFRLSGNVL